jgi:hypothetical protein
MGVWQGVLGHQPCKERMGGVGGEDVLVKSCVSVIKERS